MLHHQKDCKKSKDSRLKVRVIRIHKISLGMLGLGSSREHHSQLPTLEWFGLHLIAVELHNQYYKRCVKQEKRCETSNCPADVQGKNARPQKGWPHTQPLTSVLQDGTVKKSWNPLKLAKDQTPPSVSQTSWETLMQNWSPRATWIHMKLFWNVGSIRRSTWVSQWQSEAFCHLFHDVKHRSGDDRLNFSTI